MAGPVRLAYRSREAGGGGSMVTHALAHHATAAGGSFSIPDHGVAVA
jgi:hypothetical protein